MICGLCWLSGPALAEQSPSFDQAALSARFANMGLEVQSIRPADIDGLLEIETPSGVLYSNLKGDHFIAGTLYTLDDNGQYIDVMAKRQAPINAKKLAAMKDQTIEYQADDEKYVVTVFTDITCGYCMRLHSQMEQYNQLGITVRYLAFPRQGLGGSVADNMAKVWCAEDPKSALSAAKNSRIIPTAEGNLDQCRAEVKAQYDLGRELEISGTPAIFMPNGEMVGGYLPASALLQRLQQAL
ncbi:MULTISPECIES: thioredoxin fold domain-containing protein [unclassified Vibrio]|uniref:Thiol:disulfide interchange protein n=1 Tax=Vibrio sp. HB236076 TaxID=3232307 RepID=A0AB39HJ92_9VIBR|nr:thioredoxin fold domain-containing protein [Vibrio sp. HB161653]MDP5254588.1 thioredoxin fold domain-containing protein [Vibrio sp. HB161653]